MIHFSVQRLIGVCALALAALLTGCGGASSTVNPLQASRVVAFGDALSAVGNGSATSLTSLDGRLTINGDGTNTLNSVITPTTLPEVLANVYGLWTTPPVKALITGASQNIPSSGKLVSYAVANSMINPSASVLSGDTLTYRDGLGGTDAPLSQQVQQFINYDGGPKENDLIIVTAGTRDLLSLAVRYLGSTGTTKLADGTTSWAPATNLVAKLGGPLTKEQVFTQLDATTTELVAQVDKLIAAGAKHVVVLEPLNLSRTPWGLSLDTASVAFLRSLSYDTDTSCIKGNAQNSLHCKLTIALSAKYPPTVYGQKILAVDVSQYVNLMSGTTTTGSADTYVSYFSQLPTIPACSVVPPIASPMTIRTWDISSLSASYTTGCDANANGWVDTTFTGFMFADNLNLSPQGNLLLGSYIYNSSMYRAAWR
jgi:phospholipase/lecithinase/hemolysin